MTQQQNADAYLDYLARSSDENDRSSVLAASAGDCGGWTSVGLCESGHGVARKLRCGREWCADCGQKDSDAHKRRWSRWLPKVRQLRRMGYLVVTFPPSERGKLRSKPELSAMARSITDILRVIGFERGLRRWHWFGDESPRYHPHLNFLLDSALVDRNILNTIKSMIAKHVGVPCVVHYQWTDAPKKMMHLLKYVTRPTFLSRSWDEELAEIIYKFRTTWAWGKWQEPPAWSLNTAEEHYSEELNKVSRGQCPDCGDPIRWGRKPIAAWWLTAWDATEIAAGYYRLPHADHPTYTNHPPGPYPT